MMTTRKHSHDPHEPERRSETVEPPDSQGVSSMEAKLQERTAELESGVAEAKGRSLRSAADFENYKKRARQQQMDTIQHASADLISRLLPALDDLHNALDHKPAGVEEPGGRGLGCG